MYVSIRSAASAHAPDDATACATAHHVNAQVSKLHAGKVRTATFESSSRHSMTPGTDMTFS